MPNVHNLSMARAAGLILILGSVSNFVAVWMFSVRTRALSPSAVRHPVFVTERIFIVAAVIITALGFVLLEGAFRDQNGHVLAKLGATAYLLGAILITTGELLGLNLGGDVREFGPMYVVISFLAQACIGGAILLSRIAPTWIGWTALVWSIGWLVLLPVVSPIGIYFPVLHHVVPLVLGVALLTKTP